MKNKSFLLKLLLYCFVIVCFIFVIYLYEYMSSKYDIGIVCVLNEFFGVYCPGCGLTRAMSAMFELDFYQAFRYNALSLIILPVLFLTIVLLIFEVIFDRESIISKIPIQFWIVIFGVLLFYGIIRNFIPYLKPTEI